MAENFSVFEAVGRRLNWLSQRQGVLSQNIANADTPDYKARQLEKPSFVDTLKQRLEPMQPKVTDAGHINADVPEPSKPEAEQDEQTYETTPTGNSVVLEEQMVTASKTKQTHQEMTNLYRKYMDMFSMAWGKRAG